MPDHSPIDWESCEHQYEDLFAHTTAEKLANKIFPFNFCPWCGKKLRKEKEDED